MDKQTRNKLAYDFDGTASEGVYRKGSIIITGRPKEANKAITDLLGDAEIHNYPKQGEHNDEQVGRWKSAMIRVLGVTKYFNDNEIENEIIRKENPDVEVVQVHSHLASEKKMKFIIFTFDGTILPIAWKLMKEGNQVTVGMIEDNHDILTKGEKWHPESPEKNKERHGLYKGLVTLHPAKKVLKAMTKIKDKENYFILADSNNTFKFTQLAEKMGFTGFMPREQDRVFEVERSLAKDFAIENYPEIEIQEVEEFKSVEDGIAFLEETEKLWVLKSEGDDGDTVVPESEDPELAKEQLIDSLQKQQKEYESNGFILEEKILNPIEVTPEFMFWNGELVCSTIDLENKPVGSGNKGSQTGCGSNLIFTIDETDPIHAIACPPKVYEMAKEKKGLFVWDISILISEEGRMFFGEFCSNRFGWDAFPTELSMCKEDDKICTPFFEKIIKGENPFTSKYGAGVRLFNIDQGCKILEDGLVEWKEEGDLDLFIYEMKLKNGKHHSTASSWDFAVATGASNDIDEAIDLCYNNADMVAFDAKYYRPQFDFVSLDYSTSIMTRYNYLIDNKLIK